MKASRVSLLRELPISCSRRRAPCSLALGGVIRWANAEAGAVNLLAPASALKGAVVGYLTEKKLVANVQFPLCSIACISSSYSVSDWRKAAGMGTFLAEAGSSTW